MATLLGSPKVQYFQTGTADFLSGGKLYSYTAGTTTPKATYPTIADALAATNANTNPIILDSRGEANVVVQGATKLILKDSSDNVIWTVDNIEQASSDILDSNGNELLKFVTTTDAVNEWTITNAATTGKPKLQATGSDTNITGQVLSKGTGDLEVDAGVSGTLELNKTCTGNINLRRATSVKAGGLTVDTGGVTVTAGGISVVAGGASVTGGITAVTGGITATSGGLTATAGGLTVVAGNTSLAATAAFNLVPAGTVVWKASTTVPAGWLECDGSAVSRTTYATLYADIGTTFGSGDGSTTFNLPTQARRTLVGKGGSGTATLSDTVGSTGGSETHTLTESEMPAHTHSYTRPTSGAIFATGGDYGNNTTAQTGSTGGGTAHNNMQPSLVMMMIIRAY